MSKLAIEGVGRIVPRRARRRAPTVALQPTSLTVADNDFITILGPSGCGKSTLLRIVAGLDAPTTGRVLLDGDAGRSARRRSRHGVPELHAVSVADGARKHLLRPARKRRAARAQQDEHRRALASNASASRASSITIRSMLSGGMQQRTAIARALANDPKILLLDEPFGALDNQTRRLMQELLLSIWEAERKTVLFVTHDIEEAIFMANRVVVMSRGPGRIKADVAVIAAASAPLHGEDDAGILGAEGAPDRGDPRRGAEPSRSPGKLNIRQSPRCTLSACSPV